jgi:ABC-type transport system involved in cytochrome bd biosynthesis fused ATPase/permease subunit
MDTVGALTQNGIIDNVKDLGFGVGFMVLCFVIVFYILRQQKDILQQAKEERAVFLSTIEKFTKAIDDHTAQAREFHNNVTEAHKYQREEHKDMAESQNSICSTLALVASKLSG